ncbi:sialidase family protein [Micromonospora sp. NPDC049559]|uniref:sialidase family protein n=1 Tax=Micromonospora sp. NPDC049559 TaxID=3155923 RepID=UPI003449852E
MSKRTLVRVALAALTAALLGPPLTAPPPASAGTAEPPAGQQIFHKGDGGYACFRIPSVVRANYPDADGVLRDELVAFAEGRRDSCSDHGDIDIVSRRSVDDGKTWGAVQMVVRGWGMAKSNPTPVAIPGTATIVLLSVLECGWPSTCGRTPRATYSHDGGLTWPTSPAPNDLLDDLGFGDTPPFWLAFGPGHAVKLSTGRLVAGVNFVPEDGGPSYGGVVYSDNDGADWRMGPVQEATGTLDPQEISVAELSDGRVYLSARNHANEDSPTDDKCANAGHDNRLYAILDPGAGSFRRRFQVESDLVTPLAYSGVLRAGNQLLFAGPSICDRRHDLRVRTSFNSGCSWETDANQGTQLWSGDAAYTDLAPLRSGKVLVLAEAGPDMDANRTISWFVHTPIAAPGDIGTLKVTPEESGSGNDACLEDGTTLTAGRSGNAASLGSGSYVKVPYAENLAPLGNDFTWTGWFAYGPSATTQALLWAYNTGAGKPQVWLRLERNANGLPLIRGHAETTTSAVDMFATDPLGGTLDDQVWHHFALVRAGGTLALYLDGGRLAQATGLTGSVSADPAIADAFRIYLGRRLDGVYPFTGKLDDYRYYNRALPQSEVATLFGGGDVTGGLQLRLPFDRTR